MKNIPTQGGIDGFNIIPETLQEVTPWVRNYRNPPNPINIPYNWYLEVHHVLSMLNDQVDGLNSCGIRLNGALKQNDPDQVMHFVVNNVVFNPGTQEYLDVLTNGKVFEYTKTCPNICGIMDQTKSFEPSSNYAKPLPFSWLIRKEKLLQIIDGDKINPSFIKVTAPFLSRLV